MDASHDFHNNSTHPSHQRLAAFAVGAIDEHELDEISHHLDACEQCCDWLCQYQVDDPLLSGLQGMGLRAPDAVSAQREMAISLVNYVPKFQPPQWDNACPLWVKQYRVDCEIGKGGMGIVYKATDTVLRRTVAIKMILHGRLGCSADRVRFRVEAELAARVRHPNVVQVYEVGEHRGQPFVAFEWVEGGNLASTLVEATLTHRQSASIIEQVARAVFAAHTQGVIHRDLKPANILLTNDGVPKVADFGLARRFDHAQGFDKGQGLTCSGSLLGTPQYMSPEQAAGDQQAIGPATDIYSLGAMLYELLAGQPPFVEPSTNQTLRSIIDRDPLPLRSLSASVPIELEIITQRCLYKNPDDRYPTAQTLADDLGRYLSNQPILARRLSMGKRFRLWYRRNRVVASLIVLLASVLASSALATGCLAYIALAKAAEARADASEARASEAKAINMVELARESDARAQMVAYDAHAMLLQNAWQDKQVYRFTRLLEQLADVPLENRGFEWYFWNTRLQSTSQTILHHDGLISASCFNPDGNFIACADVVGIVEIFSSANLKLVSRLDTQQGQINCLCFAAGDSQVITAGEDFQIKLFDIATGQLLRTFVGHEDGISHVQITSHGLLSASRDGTVRLWNLEDGRELHRFDRGNRGVNSFAVDPGQQKLVTAGVGQLQCWDLATRKPIAAWNVPPQNIPCLTFSPDGQLLAFAGTKGIYGVLDSRTGLPKFPFQTHAYPLYCVGFDCSGQTFYTAGNDAVIRKFDSQTGREFDSLLGHLDNIASLTCHPQKEKTLVSASADGTARLWTAEHEPNPLVLMDLNPRPLQFGFDRRGRWIAVPSNTPEIKLLTFSSDRRKIIGSQTCPLAASPTITVFSPSGRHLIAATAEHEVVVCALADTSPLALTQMAARKFPAEITCLEVDDLHNRLAVGLGDGRIMLCGLDSLKIESELSAHRLAVWGMRFDDRPQDLYSTSLDGAMMVWNCETGDCLRTLFQHHDRLFKFAFSPAVDELAVASEDGTVQIRHRHTGKLVQTLYGHSGPVRSVSYSPDGRRLATGGFDCSVRIWDTATWHEVLNFTHHSGEVMDVQFSPHGRSLAAIANQGQFQFWRTEYSD